MGSTIDSAITGIRDYGWQVLYASLFCLALELTLPANRCSLQSRLRAAGFWSIYIIITATSFAFFNAVWAALELKPFPHNLTSLTGSESLWLKIAGWTIAAIAAITVGEFFYYWFHRLHAVPFLWKFHEVHHSIREMSGLNSNHHFTEEIFRIPFVIVPLSLLINVNTGYIPALVYAILRLQGQFQHSCTRYHLGPLRCVIADNRFHRIHHSLEEQHWDKNFGSFTSVWDLIFRTAHFPKKGEWPDVGLPYIDEPRTIREFLLRPFNNGKSPSQYMSSFHP
ncbi:MAG: sterol desaturase family protein [Pseudomonadota bacterium]|nr:sterol desaturase family protein [Pseudomonadota bacterium]